MPALPPNLLSDSTVGVVGQWGSVCHWSVAALPPLFSLIRLFHQETDKTQSTTDARAFLRHAYNHYYHDFANVEINPFTPWRSLVTVGVNISEPPNKIKTPHWKVSTRYVDYKTEPVILRVNLW